MGPVVQQAVILEGSAGFRNSLTSECCLGSYSALRPCVGNKDKRSQPFLVIGSLSGHGSAASDGTSGDAKVQQMLVDMVRIQVGKARMIEFVDERSQHLRSIAYDVGSECDRIAYRAMKDFDASGRRVLRQFDADASAIEKELMIARNELEAESRAFEDFQIRIAYSRNEGLFFKNLYKAPTFLRYQRSLSKDEREKKVTVVTSNPNKDLGASYRQLLYGGISLVMVSFIWSSGSAFVAGTCMRASKLASYGVIFSLLLAQLAYAKVITGESDDVGEAEK